MKRVLLVLFLTQLHISTTFSAQHTGCLINLGPLLHFHWHAWTGERYSTNTFDKLLCCFSSNWELVLSTVFMGHRGSYTQLQLLCLEIYIYTHCVTEASVRGADFFFSSTRNWCDTYGYYTFWAIKISMELLLLMLFGSYIKETRLKMKMMKTEIYFDSRSPKKGGLQMTVIHVANLSSLRDTKVTRTYQKPMLDHTSNKYF